MVQAAAATAPLPPLPSLSFSSSFTEKKNLEHLCSQLVVINFISSAITPLIIIIIIAQQFIYQPIDRMAILPSNKHSHFPLRAVGASPQVPVRLHLQRS